MSARPSNEDVERGHVARDVLEAEVLELRGEVALLDHDNRELREAHSARLVINEDVVARAADALDEARRHDLAEDLRAAVLLRCPACGQHHRTRLVGQVRMAACEAMPKDRAIASMAGGELVAIQGLRSSEETKP